MERNGIRVVIADDEPITRMDIKEMLESVGYKVIQEAADGFDAVEACKKLHPDLVLMDIKMPLLDGFAAARIINDELLADTIIILTAYSDQNFVEQAKAVGADGYLVKPIEERALIPSIELAMSRSAEMKRLRIDIQKANDRLENRVLIEKAKGRIMAENNMTEQEAYDYIRKLSLEKAVSMRRVAEIILVQLGESK
ncbi:MAG: response regulator [Clostridiales bacterium]|jgi:AmiR/NasT family two-component response regulator|nr:response regulator [Clostridiales bacterium]